jgi:hypothetical protein
VEGNRLH